MGRSGAGTDLERKPGRAEERKFHGVEYGLNLLPLGCNQTLPRSRCDLRTFTEKVLVANNGWYSTLHSVPGGDSATSVLSRDSLDRVVRSLSES